MPPVIWVQKISEKNKSKYARLNQRWVTPTMPIYPWETMAGLVLWIHQCHCHTVPQLSIAVSTMPRQAPISCVWSHALRKRHSCMSNPSRRLMSSPFGLRSSLIRRGWGGWGVRGGGGGGCGGGGGGGGVSVHKDCGRSISAYCHCSARSHHVAGIISSATTRKEVQWHAYHINEAVNVAMQVAMLEN